MISSAYQPLSAKVATQPFVLVLPQADAVDVHHICQRIRQVIESQSHAVGSGQSIQITISIGYVSQSGQTQFKSSDLLLHAADEALYAAKHQGRNRVVAYSEDQDPKVSNSGKGSPSEDNGIGRTNRA